jgi:hypothetical protein
MFFWVGVTFFLGYNPINAHAVPKWRNIPILRSVPHLTWTKTKRMNLFSGQTGKKKNKSNVYLVPGLEAFEKQDPERK